jgi:hypothetical protein
MSKLAKKMMVGTLCASMVLGSTVTAFALDEGSSTTPGETAGDTVTIGGSSTVEGIVNKDVFKVVLPTVPQSGSASALDFTLDPQKLITAVGTKNVNGASLIFTNAATTDGGSATYSNTSDALTVTNKGTVPVDVTLQATIDGLDDGTDSSAYTIVMAEDDKFENDTTSSIYVAVKAGNDDPVPLNDEDDGITINKVLKAAPDGSYEVKQDADSKAYSYVLKSDATGFDSIAYKLTGAANTNGDWSEAAGATPSVSLVWTVDKHESVFTSTTKGVISYDPSAVTSVSKIEMTYAKTNTDYNVMAALAKSWAAATVDSDEGTITLDTANIIKAFSITSDTYATVTYVVGSGDDAETKTDIVKIKFTN